MKIKIVQPYEDMRRKMGLSINKIKQTIIDPDNATRIDLNKLQLEITKKKVTGKTMHVGLYLKRFKKDDKEYHIFVLTTEPSVNLKNVINALLITEELIPNLDELSPIDILRRISESFGIPINIQGKTQTFFYKELIPLKARTKLFEIGQKKNDEIIHFQLFMKIVPGSNQVFCALVSSINQSKYLDWLARSFKR